MTIADAEEKYRTITRALQEVQGEEELKKILAKRDLKVYWGTSTTGRPHVAYFIPIMKLADFLQAGCEVTVLLADLHAVLDNQKAPIELLNARVEYYHLVIRCMLQRIGAPLEKIKIVKGTDFQLEKDYVIDMHKLSTLVTVHNAQRAGSEVVKQTSNPILSGLVYPGMQALDEQYLNVDAQFGGIDQRKIFIYAQTYLPALGYKKRIHLMSPMVPGLTMGKMSSSEPDSKIELSDTDADIKRKISKCFCQEGVVEPNGVLSLAKSLIIPMQQEKAPFEIEIYKTKEVRKYTDEQTLDEEFKSMVIHPADLKQAVIKYLIDLITPIRKEIDKHRDLVLQAYPPEERRKKSNSI